MMTAKLLKQIQPKSESENNRCPKQNGIKEEHKKEEND